MAITFYDISVASYLQTLGAVSGFLAKGREHCTKNGIDLKDVLETRLIADMFPFRAQVFLVTHHSLGAIKGIEAGAFSPPQAMPELDYADLEKLVTETRSSLQQYPREAIEALEGRDVEFRFRERVMPFVARDFVLSFSLPNFYFHATTAYDILRMKGAPIGKRDFMGMPRIKA